MPTISYSADTTCVYGINSVPQQVQNTNTHVRTMSVSNGKTSVDTGAFQPGVYRVNPYEVWREELDLAETNQEFTYLSSPEWYMRVTGQLGCIYLAGQISKDEYQTRADDLMKLAHQKAQAKVGQSDLSLGEDLGELKETLAMLKNPLSSLQEFLLKDSGRNLKTIKSLLKFRLSGSFAGQTGKAAATAAANTWLEVRYGFRPLIMLLGDLMEQANKKANSTFRPDVIRSAKAQVKAAEYMQRYGRYRGPYLIKTPSYDKRFEVFWYLKDVVNMTAYASVQYRQSSPMSALQKLGLTPEFWPEIAWELTKLSFVWDWFVSVGPWLASYRFKPTITILGTTTGIKREIKRTVDADFVMLDWRGLFAPIDIPGERRLYAYRRYVNPELSLTPLLRLDKVLDLNKLVDSLSLILQRILR